MISHHKTKMFSEEYRRSDEYLALKRVVLDVAPNLPAPLVEHAIFMHKRNPRLYREIEKLERQMNKQKKNLMLIV